MSTRKKPPQRRTTSSVIKSIQSLIDVARTALSHGEGETLAVAEGAASIPADCDFRSKECAASDAQTEMMLVMLQTVNAHLASALADLELVRNDLENLIGATQVAAVFVDDNLNIRRFTPLLTTLYGITLADIGKPLPHMPAALDYPYLESDFQRISRTETPVERFVNSADGRSHYVMRMRRYHQRDGSIDGAAIIFAKLPPVESHVTLHA